jgi:hypothetical protein
MSAHITEKQLQEIAEQAEYIYTEQEVHERERKESRHCPCWDDLWLCSKLDKNGQVELECLVYRKRHGYGVLVRAERPCGFVGFWPEEWMLSPTSGNFWHNLHRRIEKQCASLYYYQPPEPLPAGRTKKDRKRQSATWRRR